MLSLVRCDFCQQPIEVNAEDLGGVMECPHCLRETRLHLELPVVRFDRVEMPAARAEQSRTPARSSYKQRGVFTVRFKNPANDYVEESSCPWLWAFAFGAFYFAAKRIWGHAVAYFGLAFLLAVLFFPLLVVLWFAYAACAHDIVCKYYYRRGWIRV